MSFKEALKNAAKKSGVKKKGKPKPKGKGKPIPKKGGKPFPFENDNEAPKGKAPNKGRK